MRFNGELSKGVQARVEACDRALVDPARLEALRRSGLMDSPREQAFDRLAELAARILKAPLTIISLVGSQKQFFKAAYGLPPPFNVTREIPIDGSICRYTLRGEPIVVEDAARDPLLQHHPTTGPWGIVAFMALPMVTAEGYVLGAFCAVDSVRRRWSDDDIYVLRELTASVMTEITLRMQVDELEAGRQLRERFVASFTHDLRTPLTSAKMGAQFLALKGAEPELVRQLASRIVTGIDRADGMIRDLLDVSRLNAGESLPMELGPCDLSRIAADTLAELSLLHGNRFSLQADANVQGLWNESGLRRILENLCNNAVKYGSVDRPITVTVRASPVEAQLGVHNEGLEIPAEDRPHIFAPFRRSAAAQSGKQKGWGLGLALVRGLAESLGGSIALHSPPGGGTTFVVSLPR